MKNYKILENRAELSSKELTEAMDFTKLKANVTVASKTIILKSIIIKTIFGAAIITSGIWVYNTIKVTAPKQKSHKLIAVTDTSKNVVKIEAKPMVDTIKKISKTIIKVTENAKVNMPVQIIKIEAAADTLKTVTAIIPLITTSKNCNGTVIQNYDSLSREKDTETTSTKRENIAKNTKVKSCIIWRPNNYCDIANTLIFKYTIECDACEFDEVNCNTVTNTNDLVCILVTLSGNQKQNFKIEGKLNNISLINSTNNNKQHPSMVGIGNANKFIGSGFKAKKCVVNFNKEINVILFFKTAKVGDKILINNFIEAQIEN